MAIEKSFADDAKTSNDPNDSAQNGDKAGADKSNGSKSSVAEIRTARLRDIPGAPRRTRKRDRRLAKGGGFGFRRRDES